MARASGHKNITASKTEASEYGLHHDASQRLKGVVKPGQTLSGILQSYRVPYEKINAVALESRGVFDVRKIRAGRDYAVITGRDSVTHPSFLIYEETPVDYVVFKVEDPINVYRGKKKVKVDVGKASGAIETSLVDSLKEHQFAHQLAFKLSELYAWTIDFYHLQRGDHYEVIFEEQSLAGKPLGLEKILAARFNHRGQDFYAFYFENGDGGKYYDQMGASVEKALLESPLKHARITSRFSKARLHPILKRRRPHLGIDFAAPRGTPIVSVGDGLVLKSGHDKYRGKYLAVRHNGVYSTQYYHMSGFAKGIRSGVRVKQGEIIGYVGSTGLATGPHLEFRLLKRGRPVDPLKEDIPAGEPLEKDYIETFKRQAMKLKISLDRIEMAETSGPPPETSGRSSLVRGRETGELTIDY
jgi:murein DD-endopeptidase MepM/ murein hydrolase activator NlpD